MAQHDDDDDAHRRGNAHAHDPAADERMSREILADRERVFDLFVKIAAWHVVGIFLVLALLALTQT